MSVEKSCELKDTKFDRQAKNVPVPYQKALPSNLLWKQPNKPNSETLHKFQIKEGKLSKQDFLNLIRIATRLLAQEPNVLQLEDPLTVVGDIHGQYYDLHTLLYDQQFPSAQNHSKFLFLGDYVDRGHFSCEVITLLLSLKIEFPDRIFLLRGNHESAYCTVNYGFQAEILRKYDQEIYQALLQCFNSLPLIAVLNGTFVSMHGGISPEMQNLQQANQINRNQEIPTNGMLCDIVWSDPTDKNPYTLYSYNDQRGCSNMYNQNAVQQFLQQNNLSCIIRAHEVKQLGFDQQFRDQRNLPLVITIFSAPFYGKQYQNLGAVIQMRQSKVEFKQYKFNNEEPFFYEFKNPTCNKYDNVFKWSLSFISEQVAKIAVDLLSQTITQEQEQQIDRDIDSFQRKMKGAKSMPVFEQVKQDQNLVPQRPQTIVNNSFQIFDRTPQNETAKNNSIYNPLQMQIKQNFQQRPFQSEFQQPYNNYQKPYQNQSSFQNIQRNYSQQSFQPYKVYQNSHQTQWVNQPHHGQFNRHNYQTKISLDDKNLNYFSVFDQSAQNPNLKIAELQRAQQKYEQQNKETLQNLRSFAQQNKIAQNVNYFDASKFQQQVQQDKIYEGRFF